MAQSVFQKLGITFDPWQPDYGTAFSSSEETEEEIARLTKVDTDVEVESAEWKPILPSFQRVPEDGATAFLDGIRRIEVRINYDRSGRLTFGAVGSFAVGAVALHENRVNDVDGSLLSCNVRRLLLLAADPEMPGTFDLASSETARINLEVMSIDGSDTMAPLVALQNEMRQSEGSLAHELSTDDRISLLIADGPLSLPLLSGHVVGYVKTIHAIYLPEELQPILFALKNGERTPLFHIGPKMKAADPVTRYSCYLRIHTPLPRHTALTGVVRLEVPGTLSLEEAIAVINEASAVIPKYSTPYGRDPRAPQNLLPLAALERQMRRRLGSQEIIRRILEDHF